MTLDELRDASGAIDRRILELSAERHGFPPDAGPERLSRSLRP